MQMHVTAIDRRGTTTTKSPLGDVFVCMCLFSQPAVQLEGSPTVFNQTSITQANKMHTALGFEDRNGIGSNVYAEGSSFVGHVERSYSSVKSYLMYAGHSNFTPTPYERWAKSTSDVYA